MSNSQFNVVLEDVQNFSNWNKAMEVPVLKRKRFLASKIHKLKKILKLGSKTFSKNSHLTSEEWQNQQNEMESRQNRENDELERKFLAMKECDYEHENMVNENWENWDSCYLCQDQCPYQPYEPYKSKNSVCYVFMPGQAEPVPVKLRNARIPGGVMWIVYRPDVDICDRDNLYSFTSSQIPQAQRPILV